LRPFTIDIFILRLRYVLVTLHVNHIIIESKYLGLLDYTEQLDFKFINYECTKKKSILSTLKFVEVFNLNQTITELLTKSKYW
jgi:hypothetical protein